MAVLKSPRNSRKKKSWALRYSRTQLRIAPRLYACRGPRDAHRVDLHSLNSSLKFLHHVRRDNHRLEELSSHSMQSRGTQRPHLPYPMVLTASARPHFNILRITSFLVP